MTNYPELSIITPVLNGIRFIEQCIINVVEQKCPDMEHIIVDGGSTDGTAEIIKSYAERYGHIRWISENDHGQSDAMNKGIAIAKGNIIGFLNFDDFYEPGALNFVLEKFVTLPEPSLFVGNCNVWDDNGILSYVSTPSQIGYLAMLLEKYVEAFPMNPSAYFYHSSLHKKIGLYKIEEHFGMDIDFIFKAVQHAHVTYVNKMFGNYRYLEGTKTFNDCKSGNNPIRVRAIAKEYRNTAPFFLKWYVNVTQAMVNVKNALINMTKISSNG